MAAGQTANETSERTEGMGTALKRRGLMAGAAALVAGMVATKTSQPVAAAEADYDSFTAISGGSAAYYAAPGTNYANGVVVYATGVGVHGIGKGGGIGVQGDGAGTGTGVLGNGGSNGAPGVQGNAGGSDVGVYGTAGGGNAAGVYGTSSGATGFGVGGLGSGTNGTGVSGTGNGNGAGVVGRSPTTGVQGNGGGDTSGNTTGFPIGVRGSIPNSGYGVYGNAGIGAGVYGTATNGVGTEGIATTGTGVLGQSSGNPSSKAIYGHHTGSGYGVVGDAGDGGYGVTGVGTTSYGVLGVSTSGTATRGQSTSGIGVSGFSSTNVGVFGVSNGGSGQPYGVVGSVNSAPGFGLFGVTNVAGTVGFAGGAGVAGAIAGQFAGPVNIYNNGAIAPGDLYIQGNYTASGTKSAAVLHPDGTHRLLYCVESPEAWFEDFGEGTLVGGKAAVTLDADFAAVVDTSKLHVFLTPHDEHHLHVANRATNGFSVVAAPSTTAAATGTKASDLSGTFSYRVVAKRKDVAAPRLAKFEPPKEITAATPLVIPTFPKDDKEKKG